MHTAGRDDVSQIQFQPIDANDVETPGIFERTMIVFTTVLIAMGWFASDRANANDQRLHEVAVQQEQGAEIEAEKEAIESSEESKAPFDRQTQLDSFDKVWTTIDTVHWDEELVGQKWDEAKTKYREQVEKATTVAEVRDAIEEMIGELGQSHFGLIPKHAYDVVGDISTGDANAGLTLRAIDDEIVVSKVRPGSSAAKAGIVPGWTVSKIKDKEVTKIAEKVRAAAKGPMRYETLAGLAFEKVASGEKGESIDIVMTDEKGETRELNLELSLPEGTVARFGHLPPIRVTSESKTLEGNIGYFTFSAFFDPVKIMPAFRNTVSNENHSNGIIIDVRGNIGGIAGMTMGMASVFAPEATVLGVMTMKGNELKFAVNSAVDPVTCPVAVLVDECSISSAEIFSGGLQDLGIARVFGARTAGLALPSTVIKLPNGDGFQYAIANYKSASGKSLEMDGVTPDEPVALSRDLLLRDSDPVLSQALEWIKNENE